MLFSASGHFFLGSFWIGNIHSCWKRLGHRLADAHRKIRQVSGRHVCQTSCRTWVSGKLRTVHEALRVDVTHHGPNFLHSWHRVLPRNTDGFIRAYHAILSCESVMNALIKLVVLLGLGHRDPDAGSCMFELAIKIEYRAAVIKWTANVAWKMAVTVSETISEEVEVASESHPYGRVWTPQQNRVLSARIDLSWRWPAASFWVPVSPRG